MSLRPIALAVLVLTGTSAAAQDRVTPELCQPSDLARGWIRLARDLAGPSGAAACVQIRETLSSDKALIREDEFPSAKQMPVAAAGASREAAPPERLVYYALTLPPAVSVEWQQSPRQPDTVLTLTSFSSQDLFSVVLYSKQRAIVGTYSPRAEQQLLLTGKDLEAIGEREFLIEVRFENEFDSGRGGFSLQWTSRRPVEPTRERMRAESPILQAYANRRVLDSSDYDELIAYATCDTANRAANNTCRQEDEQKTHVMIDRLVPRDLTEDEEPVIAFIGIGGTNRIVLINKRGESKITRDGVESVVSSFTPRYRRTLPGARWFWALFIEDDLSPFETSIDVEFKPRATVSEVDEFDPSSLVSLGMKASNAGRAVRIGMRRIRVRNPPVAVEVAFSRLGAGYGLRQWRQVYRMRSWNLLSVGAGVFIPFITVGVETHDLVEPGLPSGEIPDFVVITPRVSRRQIFAMGEIFVPAWRNLADEAVDRRQKVLGYVLPHAVVGIGLPGEGGQAYYAGMGWNVAWERVGISVGALISQQSHLTDGFRAGQRLFDKTIPLSAVAETKFVGTLLFGVTVDLLRVR